MAKEKTYQQRVIDEKVALDTKINDLSNFRCTEKYLELSHYSQGLLTRQLDAMQTYAKILQERIDDFNR